MVNSNILSKTVLQLNNRIRQENNKRTIEILDDIEEGKPSENTINYLLKLKLSSLPQEKQHEINKKSNYIFATHFDKNEHNCRELLKFATQQIHLHV